MFRVRRNAKGSERDLKGKFTPLKDEKRVSTRETVKKKKMQSREISLEGT